MPILDFVSSGLIAHPILTGVVLSLQAVEAMTRPYFCHKNQSSGEWSFSH